jgi:dienelactone hydrolase
MKHQSVAHLLHYFAVSAFLLFFSFHSNAQVQTARPTSINGNCGGYYEYLPQGYSSNTWQSYPLIVAVHGIGELGNGTSDLGNLLNCWTSLPRRIANGGFPSSFNVGGQNFSFIVISPQFKAWPSSSDINDAVNYAIQNYRVDQSRVYVTGLSMGGGAVWTFAGDYPTKATAVVPVCGAWSADATRAQAIANAKLPVWATHNQYDPTVAVNNTTGWVSSIGQYGGNIISTIFPVSGHDAWTQTYDPAFTQNGVNIYQWMLQHQKGSSTTSSNTNNSIPSLSTSYSVPVNSTTRIEAESYSAMSGVQAENTQDIGGGQDVGWIDAGDWMDYSLNVSSAGTYNLKLRVASPSGGQLQLRNSSGSVLATVNIPATGAYQTWQTISSSVSLAAGSQTIRVYASGGGWNVNWMELSGGTSTGTNLSTSGGSNLSSGTTRIEAENYSAMSGIQAENTQDVGGGQDVGWIDAGDWMDYSANVSSAGAYNLNLRVASPSGGQLQIRNSSGSVLATVNIPATGGYQSWQTISSSVSLAAGSQTIRVYASSSGWNLNWMEIGGSASSTTNTSSGGTTHIEAENYANMNGVAKENTTDIGGGQDVGYIDNGDWMDYNVNVSASGTYAVNLRLASPNGGQLQIKNSNGTVLATVNAPATGGWQNWQTVSANISLSAGSQTLRVYCTSTGWNFNWWEISGGSGTVSAASVSKAEVVSSTTLTTAAALSIFPNPIVDKFQLQVNNDLTGSVSVQIYDMQGSLQKQFALSKPDVGSSQFYLSIGQLPTATYIIKVTMKDWTDSKQIIKQ